MPRFVYRARDDEGLLVKGRVEAPDMGTLDHDLEESGLIPITIRELKHSFSLEDLERHFEKVDVAELIIFTRQMGTLYKAGVPLVRAIRSLEEQTRSKRLRSVLEKVRDDVEAGSTFADALSSHPEVFDELYVGMVEAGEAGGVLDQISVALPQSRFICLIVLVEDCRETVHRRLVSPIRPLRSVFGQKL